MEKDREVHSYAMQNPSNWEWTFLLDQKVKFDKMVGNAEIEFHVDEGNKTLKGFTIKIQNKNGWEANWEVFEKAKAITNLLSVIYGEFISAYPHTMKIINKFGESKSSIMNVYDPNKPYQELIVDLSAQNVVKLLNSQDDLEILHHLANALHNSYENPESSIRELVLAYGDTSYLPQRFQKYQALRHALSHKEVWNHIKTQIQTDFPQSEFVGNKLDMTSSFNRVNLIMENFFFLHNALEDFRKKYGLETKTRERVN